MSKKEIAYITKRWAIIAAFYKIMPDFIVKRMG
jgi:hypothetical protein